MIPDEIQNALLQALAESIEDRRIALAKGDKSMEIQLQNLERAQRWVEKGWLTEEREQK